jgi:hypothetical protein
MDRYDFCQWQIAECDEHIQQHLATLTSRPKSTEVDNKPPEKRRKKNQRKGTRPPSRLTTNWYESRVWTLPISTASM